LTPDPPSKYKGLTFANNLSLYEISISAVAVISVPLTLTLVTLLAGPITF